MVFTNPARHLIQWLVFVLSMTRTSPARRACSAIQHNRSQGSHQTVLQSSATAFMSILSDPWHWWVGIAKATGSSIQMTTCVTNGSISQTLRRPSRRAFWPLLSPWRRSTAWPLQSAVWTTTQSLWTRPPRSRLNAEEPCSRHLPHTTSSKTVSQSQAIS